MTKTKTGFYTRFGEHRKVGLSFTDKGRTHQEFRDECDINNIVRKAQKNGILPDMIKAEPRYGDFSDTKSYQESLNLVLFAQEQFAALSAEVREKFDNDPSKFLEFAENPKNGKEMVRLGLATERQSEAKPDALKPKSESPKDSDKPKGPQT